MMINEYNVLISGVGGQGGLTLSRIIGFAAVRDGYKLRIGETLGMSQRGGSVISYVRFGKSVYSPIIPSNGADLLIGLEPMEALRAIKYINEETVVIINERKIPPVVVNLGKREYPDINEIIDLFRNVTNKVYVHDFSTEAEKLGSIRVTNVISLGTAYHLAKIPLSEESIIDSIRSIVPEKYIDMNLLAYKKGKEIGEKIISSSQQ